MGYKLGIFCGRSSQNWSKLVKNWSKMAEIVKIFQNFFSIVPWQGYFYDLFFFFPFPFCPRFFSLLRACCNFLASLSAFFSALIASRRFSRNIDESQVGLLRYGLSSAKVRTRRRWLMFLHNRLSSRRNFWNWKLNWTFAKNLSENDPDRILENSYRSILRTGHSWNFMREFFRKLSGSWPEFSHDRKNVLKSLKTFEKNIRKKCLEKCSEKFWGKNS